MISSAKPLPAGRLCDHNKHNSRQHITTPRAGTSHPGALTPGQEEGGRSWSTSRSRYIGTTSQPAKEAVGLSFYIKVKTLKTAQE